jgi:hypothetical protein
MKPISPITNELLLEMNALLQSNQILQKKRPFSTSSKEVLKILIKRFHHAQQYLKQNPHSIHSIQVPSLAAPSSELIPSEISNSIHSMNSAGTEYAFSFDIRGRSIRIYMLFPGGDKRRATERAKMIYLWLFVAYFYAPANCSQKMNIYLYFTSFMKTLPTSSHRHVIDLIHANTAYADICREDTEIYLYRDEEWFKVLIHETFHNMGLDFNGMDLTKCREQILKIMPIESRVNLPETYCEMWAEIINAAFFVISTEPTGKTLDFYVNRIEDRLHMESVFSVFQCVKVLHFLGLGYRELYTKDADSHRNRRRKYKENTNVFAYYIIKSVLMFHCGDFIDWCRKINGLDQVLQFQKKEIEKMSELFVKLFSELYKSSEFLEWVDVFEKWFSTPLNIYNGTPFVVPQDAKSTNIRDVLRTTMRMSLFEMVV